jgi:RNA polymerase sigma-B factor
MAARSPAMAPAGELVPAPRVTPVEAVGQDAVGRDPVGRDPGKQGLAGLGDLALLALVQSLPRGSQRRAAAADLLVSRYQGLVWSCVRPYGRGPVPTEDLMQVGYVALLKAIGNFDPTAGAGLATYARPCISGELKRYFRDKRWPLRVTRPVQELVLRVRDATGPLAQQLGRTPSESDLARHLEVSDAELQQARQAEVAFQPFSLDAPTAGQPTGTVLASFLGREDSGLDHMLDMHAVSTHWGELPRREQQILIMDFQGDMTQTQIGQRLRISQMHVSRLRAHALGHLRARLLDLEPLPLPARGRRPRPASRQNATPLSQPSTATATIGTIRLPAATRRPGA